MIVYLLIGIYALALIRSIMPVLKDVTAHIFFKMEHMTTVHYENGEYHVHMELVNNTEKKEAATTTPRGLFFDELSSHLKGCVVQVPLLYAADLPESIVLPINFPIDVALSQITPPPEA